MPLPSLGPSIDDNTDGSLTYTLEDNASNLATNDGSYVVAGTDVTVTDAASTAQLTAIDADNTDGSLTYTLLKRTPATAINDGSYVAVGIDVTTILLPSLSRRLPMPTTPTAASPTPRWKTTLGQPRNQRRLLRRWH